MSTVRQYIGARYVIKIYENSLDPSSAEWEASVNYEPLTMVTYNNGSYLSKKDVPASIGDPASNPTYWAQTGFYNGQIASLQSQITQIDNDIDNMKDGSVNGSLQYQINENASDISDLQDIISHITNKRIIVIADSYGDPDYNATPFTAKIQTLLGLSNSDYYSYFEGSMGAAHIGSNGHTALTLLQSHESDITDHDTISDIFMTVGLNDYNDSSSDISDAINAIYTYCKSTYPNAKLYWAFIGNSYSLTNAVMLNLYQKYEAVLRAIPDIICVENVKYIMHNRLNFKADNVHPNERGTNILAYALAKYIDTGSFDYFDQNTATLTLNGNTVTYSETIDNNTFNVMFNVMYNSGSFAYPSSDDYIQFGECSDNAIIGRGGSVVNVNAFTTDGNYQCPVPVQATISDNKLLIKHLTGAAHTMNGCQLPNFNITGATIGA